MAVNSKYQDKHVDAVINDMMALGNMVTNLLNAQVGESQRVALAQVFSKALMDSVKIQPH